MPAKLLVIGFDAASPELIERWADDGKLPAFRSLLERGISAHIDGVEGFYIGSTWPSLYTGLNPANHGFYRISQLEPGTYRFFSPLERTGGIGGTPFWKIASDAGRRVAVLDVPLSRVEPELNGVQVVEWGGHDVVFGFKASSSDVARRVLALGGEYPLPSNCDAPRTSSADFEQFIETLEDAVERKTAITVDLLARENWDLFVQVFTETHCVGHQCWHIHDPSHPAHDRALRDRLGDPLERVYVAADRALAAILEKANAAQVLLIMPHGMSAYRGAPFLLSEILFRLGVSAPPPTPRASAARIGGAVARKLWSTVPPIARKLLRPLRARLGRAELPVASVLGADPNASKCFAIPNGAPIGGIRLNLQGREPNGLLAPGAQSDEFCAELAADLLEIIDERTGRPLIAAVHRTDDLHRGSRRAALPDLLVEWNAEPPTGTTRLAGGRGCTVRAASPKIGTVEGSNTYGRTGEHVPRGMLLFADRNVLAPKRLQPVSIMDVCPTICALLGVSAPHLDGTAIADVANRGI